MQNGISTPTTIGIREDTLRRQVFLANSSFSEEILLYDFSLETGDTVTRNTYINYGGGIQNNFIVSHIDTVNIGGVLRKKIYISCSEHLIFTSFASTEAWIEGIGGNLGLLFPIFIYDTTDVCENLLICFSDNDSIIYHHTTSRQKNE